MIKITQIILYKSKYENFFNWLNALTSSTQRVNHSRSDIVIIIILQICLIKQIISRCSENEPAIERGGTSCFLTYIQDRGFNSFADNAIKLSVNKTKWTGFVILDPFFYSLGFYLNIWSNSKSYRVMLSKLKKKTLFVGKKH